VRATGPEPSLEGPWELAVCAGCGSAWTLGPVPDPAAAHETPVYEPTRGLADRLVAPLRALAERDRIRGAPLPAPGGAALEIGCGDGRLLAGLATRGIEVAGIEPSPAAALRAGERGVQIVASTVEGAEPGAGCWDLVVAWHSLEHLPDPLAVLQSVREWLAPGGALLLGVPNRSSLQARLGGDRWFHQDVPRHRVHLTERGLRELLARAGFNIDSVRHLVVEHNFLGMWQTLLNFLTRRPNVAFRALKRDPSLAGAYGELFASALLAFPTAVLAVPLELAAAATRMGGTIAVVARPLDR
jgi:SAM-dependent methyltransferase